MRLRCLFCAEEADTTASGQVCATHSEQYGLWGCSECGVSMLVRRSTHGPAICSVCIVRAQWPALPVEIREEFDRVLREGTKIAAIKVVFDSDIEPRPGLPWLQDALVYRMKALGLKGL